MCALFVKHHHATNFEALQISSFSLRCLTACGSVSFRRALLWLFKTAGNNRTLTLLDPKLWEALKLLNETPSLAGPRLDSRIRGDRDALF